MKTFFLICYCIVSATSSDLHRFITRFVRSPMVVENAKRKAWPNSVLLQHMDSVLPIPVEVQRCLEHRPPTGVGVVVWDNPFDPEWLLGGPDNKNTNSQLGWASDCARMRARESAAPTRILRINSESTWARDALPKLQKLSLVLQQKTGGLFGLSNARLDALRFEKLNSEFNAVLFEIAHRMDLDPTHESRDSADRQLVNNCSDLDELKNLIMQLHYRSVLFFGIEETSSSSWSRFSTFMSYGLRVLQHVKLEDESGPSESCWNRCFSCCRARAVVTTPSPSESSDMRFKEINQYLSQITRRIDDVSSWLIQIDGAMKFMDEAKFSTVVESYGYRLFNLVLKAFISAPQEGGIGAYSFAAFPRVVSLFDRFSGEITRESWPALRREIEATMQELKKDCSTYIV